MKKVFVYCLIALLMLSILPQIASARASDIIINYYVNIDALSDGRIQAKARTTAAEKNEPIGFPNHPDSRIRRFQMGDG